MADINIVVATHGRFGVELVKSAEMIVGKTNHVFHLSLMPGMTVETFAEQAQNLLETLDGEILTLVDLFGGTPSNVMNSLSKRYDQQVIAGINLPMFLSMYLKLSTNQAISRDMLVEDCLKSGTNAIVHTNKPSHQR